MAKKSHHFIASLEEANLSASEIKKINAAMQQTILAQVAALNSNSDLQVVKNLKQKVPKIDPGLINGIIIRFM